MKELLCPFWGGYCNQECKGPDCPYHCNNPDPFADKRGCKIPDEE